MFCLLSLLICFLASISDGNCGGVPSFSDSYTVKGTLYIPYAEIREPFYGWFDLSRGSSRIDYYGGMVKTYQLAKEGDNGSSLKVAPVTTEEFENQDTCLKVNGTAGAPIVPQSILPDLTGFVAAGQDMLNGIKCDKWKLVNINGDKVNKYTMWTRETAMSQQEDAKTVVPVRYEMKGYNTLLGSHFDHYYLDYEWFSNEAPNPSVFALEKNMSCQDFPGPGVKHIFTFNPMREFVQNDDQHVHEAFDGFKETHGKDYADQKEHNKRFEHFRQNIRYIHSRNRQGNKFTLDVNHLADRSDLELKALRGKQFTDGSKSNGGSAFPYSSQHVQKVLSSVPASIDWRLTGAVTPVKDQSVCGSCWSFGTIGAIEGAYFLKHGKQKTFSQQALIDCSWGFGNNGCDGGEDFRSYQWMLKHGGVPTEDDYGPYLGQDGYCHIDKTMDRAVISGYVNVTSGDRDALKAAVALHGPISVAIDASHKTFSFYSHGVYFDAECGNTLEQLDHAVLVVGYGTLNGEDYWLVKNSWSNYWGTSGFVLMSMKDNNCGVATDATYVTIL